MKKTVNFEKYGYCEIETFANDVWLLFSEDESPSVNNVFILNLTEAKLLKLCLENTIQDLERELERKKELRKN